MLWSRTVTRERKAVLSALFAVGETGMTVLALSVAVNMAEPKLHQILEHLVCSGQVRRRAAGAQIRSGPRSAHYQLVVGRHSAAMAPIAARRSAGLPAHGQAGSSVSR